MNELFLRFIERYEQYRQQTTIPLTYSKWLEHERINEHPHGWLPMDTYPPTYRNSVGWTINIDRKAYPYVPWCLAPPRLLTTGDWDWHFDTFNEAASHLVSKFTIEEMRSRLADMDFDDWNDVGWETAEDHYWDVAWSYWCKNIDTIEIMDAFSSLSELMRRVPGDDKDDD